MVHSEGELTSFLKVEVDLKRNAVEKAASDTFSEKKLAFIKCDASSYQIRWPKELSLCSITDSNFAKLCLLVAKAARYKRTGFTRF